MARDCQDYSVQWKLPFRSPSIATVLNVPNRCKKTNEKNDPDCYKDFEKCEDIK